MAFRRNDRDDIFERPPERGFEWFRNKKPTITG